MVAKDSVPEDTEVELSTGSGAGGGVGGWGSGNWGGWFGLGVSVRAVWREKMRSWMTV